MLVLVASAEGSFRASREIPEALALFLEPVSTCNWKPWFWKQFDGMDVALKSVYVSMFFWRVAKPPWLGENVFRELKTVWGFVEDRANCPL